MLRIALITTDNREDRRDYDSELPWFGTAPQALLEGFSGLSDQIEVHVVSCARKHLETPVQLAPNITFHSVYVPSWAWMKTAYLGNIFAVRRLLGKLKPDLVHGQGTERDAALCAVFSGYPNLITIHGNMRVHGSRSENKTRPFYKLAAWLERIAIPRTLGVVTITTYTESLVRPLVRRSWLIPNAVQSSFFATDPKPRIPPTLLFVGALDERKNATGFIRACAELISSRGWKFRLCGTADSTSAYFQELKKLASIHPWLELAGWKTRDELRIEMESATLLVLPTLEDNCPMVVLEAMAAGLPVIASRVGGIPDLLTDGRTGLMFDPAHPHTIQAAAQRMMDDVTFRESIHTAARREALNRFHPHVVASAHLRAYAEILAT